MQITYEVTLDDMVAFAVHHTSRSPARRSAMFWLYFVLIPLALVGAYWSNHSGWDMSSVLFPLVVAITFLFLLRGGAVAQRARKLWSTGKNRIYIGVRTLTLSEEGVTDAGPVSSGTYRWEAFERAEATDQYLFMYVSALTAMIVPRRTMQGMEWGEFVAGVRQMWQRYAPEPEKFQVV